MTGYSREGNPPGSTAVNSVIQGRLALENARSLLSQGLYKDASKELAPILVYLNRLRRSETAASVETRQEQKKLRIDVNSINALVKGGIHKEYLRKEQQNQVLRERNAIEVEIETEIAENTAHENHFSEINQQLEHVNLMNMNALSELRQQGSHLERTLNRIMTSARNVASIDFLINAIEKAATLNTYAFATIV